MIDIVFCFFRWLYSKFSDDINKQGIFADWCNPKHTGCMFSQAQKDAQWPTNIYAQCPFFLDYPHGGFPEEECDEYEEAKKSLKELVPFQVDKSFLLILLCENRRNLLIW